LDEPWRGRRLSAAVRFVLLGGRLSLISPCSVFSPDAWVHLGCGWLTADLSPDKF